MTQPLNTVFNFLEKDTQEHYIKKSLDYSKYSINRVLNAIQCINKLKKGKVKKYLVRGLMEAKLILEHCEKQHILYELVIYNQSNQRIKYSVYDKETDYDQQGKLINHPRYYRAYVRVWNGFTQKIDHSKPINEQYIVYLNNWL